MWVRKIGGIIFGYYPLHVLTATLDHNLSEGDGITGVLLILPAKNLGTAGEAIGGTMGFFGKMRRYCVCGGIKGTFGSAP